MYVYIYVGIYLCMYRIYVVTHICLSYVTHICHADVQHQSGGNYFIKGACFVDTNFTLAK